MGKSKVERENKPRSIIARENLPRNLKVFFDYLSPNKSHRTVITYLYILVWLHEFLVEKGSSIAHLTLRSLVGYFNHLKENGNENNEIGRRAIVIRVYAQWAFEEDKISKKEYFKIKRYLKGFKVNEDEISASRVSLNDKEINDVYAKLFDPLLRFLFWFALNTGLRNFEICNVKITDIDLDQAVVKVIKGKNAKSRPVLLGKGQVENLARLIQWRKAIKLDHDYLFFNSRGEKLTTNVLGLKMRKISKITGIRIYAHCLRYSYAVALWENGVDLVLIQRLLGHSKIETTIKYLKIREREFQKKCLESLEKIQGIVAFSF